MNVDFHHVPGRLRIRVAKLKRNESHAASAQHLLLAVEGVAAARVNLVTGSITVTYDPEVLNVEQLIELLVERGYVAADLVDLNGQTQATAMARAVELSATRAGRMIAKATFSFVVEKTIERSALALIGAIA